MWYEMADKKQWKRYVGYALFLFLSYSIGNAAAVVSTMTAGESGERNENSCNYL